MANLTIDLPDELARVLARIAEAQHTTVQQLTLERLRSLAEDASEARLSPRLTLLQVMKEPPHLTASDVDELDAVIAAGRLPGPIAPTLLTKL